MTNLSPEERDQLFRQARIQAMSGRKSGWIEGEHGQGRSKLHVGWKWSALGVVVVAIAVAAILGSSVTMDVARLSRTTTLAKDEATWEVMKHAQFVGDKIGLESLESNGQIFTLEAGTRVRIVGLNLSGAKVRVMDGVWIGQTGWVQHEYLTR